MSKRQAKAQSKNAARLIATVSNYLFRHRGPPSQTWRTFLRNLADSIAAIDLCVVQTVTFDRRLLSWATATAKSAAKNQQVSSGTSGYLYAVNQNINRVGNPADSVFYIQTGKVKLTVTSEQGKEAIVAFLKGDEFFGEACANGETLRLTTATALTECTIT